MFAMAHQRPAISIQVAANLYLTEMTQRSWSVRKGPQGLNCPLKAGLAKRSSLALFDCPAQRVVV